VSAVNKEKLRDKTARVTIERDRALGCLLRIVITLRQLQEEIPIPSKWDAIFDDTNEAFLELFKLIDARAAGKRVEWIDAHCSLIFRELVYGKVVKGSDRKNSRVRQAAAMRGRSHLKLVRGGHVAR